MTFAIIFMLLIVDEMFLRDSSFDLQPINMLLPIIRLEKFDLNKKSLLPIKLEGVIFY